MADVLANINQLNMLKTKADRLTPVIGIQFVLSRDNAGDIFKLIDLAADSRVEMLAVSHLLPQNEENAPKILYTRYENKEANKCFIKS